MKAFWAAPAGTGTYISLSFQVSATEVNGTTQLGNFQYASTDTVNPPAPKAPPAHKPQTPAVPTEAPVATLVSGEGIQLTWGAATPQTDGDFLTYTVSVCTSTSCGTTPLAMSISTTKDQVTATLGATDSQTLFSTNPTGVYFQVSVTEGTDGTPVNYPLSALLAPPENGGTTSDGSGSGGVAGALTKSYGGVPLAAWIGIGAVVLVGTTVGVVLYKKSRASGRSQKAAISSYRPEFPSYGSDDVPSRRNSSISMRGNDLVRSNTPWLESTKHMISFTVEPNTVPEYRNYYDSHTTGSEPIEIVDRQGANPYRDTPEDLRDARTTAEADVKRASITLQEHINSRSNIANGAIYQHENTRGGLERKLEQVQKRLADINDRIAHQQQIERINSPQQTLSRSGSNASSISRNGSFENRPRSISQSSSWSNGSWSSSRSASNASSISRSSSLKPTGKGRLGSISSAASILLLAGDPTEATLPQLGSLIQAFTAAREAYFIALTNVTSAIPAGK